MIASQSSYIDVATGSPAFSAMMRASDPGESKVEAISEGSYALDDTQKNRRRAQNRRCQRAFRRRKAERDAEREENYRSLQSRYKALQDENGRLRNLLNCSQKVKDEYFHPSCGPSESEHSSAEASTASSVTASSRPMTSMEGRSTYTPDTSLEPCMLRRPDEVSEHHSQDRSDACLQVDEKSASPSHGQEKNAGIGNSWQAGDVCDDANQKWLALQALSDGSFLDKRRKASNQSSSLEAAARHLDASTPTRSSSVTAPAPQESNPRMRETQSLPQTLVGIPSPSEEAGKDISDFLSWLSDPSRMYEQWTESSRPPEAGTPHLN